MVRQISKGAPELKAGHPPAGKTSALTSQSIFSPSSMETTRFCFEWVVGRICARKVASNFYCFDFVRRFIVFLLQRRKSFYSRKVGRFVATIFNQMQSSPLLLCFVVVVVALSGLWCLPDCSLASRTPCFEKCKL